MRPETRDRDRGTFVDYTRSWQRPAATEPAAAFTTPWASDAPAPRGSIPAHVAWRTLVAELPAAADAYHHRLLTAYFTDNLDISDDAVLTELAVEVGADRASFAELLVEQRTSHTEAVIAEHNEAIGQGITAVPTMVLDDVLPVPGAQEVDTIAIWIQRLIDRRRGGA